MEKIIPYKDLYIYYFEGLLDKCKRIEDSSFIGNWEEDDFSFLFFSKPSEDIVNKVLESNPHLKFIDQFNMSYEDWLGGKFTGFQAGRFYVFPPWEILDELSDISDFFVKIILDPGVVFGTGTHPTTSTCLDLIEQLCFNNQIESAVDLGCGTGVLGLAASMLGCKKILAVDFNFLAAKTTYNNIKLNKLDSKMISVQGKAEDFINVKSDLVIANIHYEIMKEIVNSDGFLEKKWFILSGLLKTQAKAILEILNKLPVKILNKRENDGIWHTFSGRIIR